MRLSVLRSTLALAAAIAAAARVSAQPRGLRTQVETSDLSFSDLHGDVSTGLSFDRLASESGSADGAASIRDVSGSNGSQAAGVSAKLDYTRPTTTTFYDLVGDLSAKWARFGDDVAVTSGAKTSLATTCGTNSLDECLLACAKTCFANNACQWFTLAPATSDCYLYRNLRPVAGDSFAAVAADAQRIAGYVKAGPPALLSAKAACTETLVYNDADSFCVTADSTFYVASKAEKASTSSSTSTAQCATSPLTLLRTFQNNFFNKGTENAMTEELKNGQLRNAAAMAPDAIGGDFSVDSFLKYIASTPLVVTTADQTVDASTLQLADAGTSTQWSYSFDAFGRVTSASSSLSQKSLLYSKDATTGKMVERADYCKPVLQTRYTYSIHALSAVKAQAPALSFGAGEIASCLFTSPNGFWNLVPQSDKSRTTGCWKQANDLIAKLLEWGFTVEFKSEPKYFSAVDAVKTEASAASQKSNDLFTDDDVATYYASTASGVGDLNFQADFPCAYFYRPYIMQASIKLADCKAGSYCSTAWPAIQKSTDSTFFTVSSNGDVEISRALAHWAFENKDGGSKSAKPSFSYLKALATATAGQCFAETGKSLQSLTLSAKLAEVFLVTKDGKCVSLSSEDGTPSIVDCEGDALRVTVDAGSTTCIAGSGDACPTFAFTMSLDKEIALKARDDLVSGSLTFGTKGCLVVDGAEVTYSTDKSDCSAIKATYITSTAVSGGDPVDPDEAVEASASSQDTAATPARKIEIDDPDPESNP